MEVERRRIRLAPRLSAAAAFVRPGARVADIGTDHAYLPIFLLQSGIAQFVTASDIVPYPLASAKRNAEEYGVSARMAFALSDGMAHLTPADADTIVIAGMGGETIADIMGSAPFDISGLEFILQPMTRTEELRRRLHGAGFAVRRASLAREGGDIYIILNAAYGAPGVQDNPDGVVPDALLGDPLLPDYLRLLLSRTEHILAGLGRAASPDRGRAAALVATADKIRTMLGGM